MSIGEEESYLDRSTIPEQPLAALQSGDPLLRMRVLRRSSIAGPRLRPPR